MIAKDFISDELPLIDKNDRCSRVLSLMDEYKVSHLPLFQGKKIADQFQSVILILVDAAY